MGLPAASLALAAGSTVISAAGSISSGRSAKKMADYQAQVYENNRIIAEENAKLAQAAGREKAQAQRIQTGQIIGEQRAQQGAGGLDVDSGSNLDVRASTAALGELDALTIRSNAERVAWGYRSQAADFSARASMSRLEGANAKRAGYMGAFASILGGASSIADKWGAYNRRGVNVFG